MAYLEVNGMKVTYEDLAKALGVPQIQSLLLCQDVASGTLAAQAGTEEYPGIDLFLRLPEKSGLDVLMARAEQPQDEPEPKAYLYDVEAVYIAYTIADTRTAEEIEDSDAPRIVVVSGDRGQQVDVYAENPYVCFMGQCTEDALSRCLQRK